MSVSSLLTKQRRRRRCRRARVSLARAPASAAPPTPPAPPLRAHSSPPLPPPQTASPASVAGPASCACPPTLPLLARVRARPGWVGEGGWGQRDLARPTHLPTLCGTVLRLRAGCLRPRHAARLHAAGHAQSGWHCGGCGGGGGWGRLGDGVAARSEEKGWPRDPETRK